jgi:hypothetical protein
MHFPFDAFSFRGSFLEMPVIFTPNLASEIWSYILGYVYIITFHFFSLISWVPGRLVLFSIPVYIQLELLLLRFVRIRGTNTSVHYMFDEMLFPHATFSYVCDLHARSIGNYIISDSVISSIYGRFVLFRSPSTFR